MKTSTLPTPDATGLHIAIIMDGNGRWATARARPRTAGHVEGARAVRRAVEHARRLGAGTLTLYAFSSDNWRRPKAEVDALLRLFRSALAEETCRCVANGIALQVIGRRDRLPATLRRAISDAEGATAHGRAMRLRIAVDYSAREAIVRAAAQLVGDRSPRVDQAAFARALATATHPSVHVEDVDLLIRTGGEQRLSDFLLWECAYAELVFLPVLWPDFDAHHLEMALHDFRSRERRFGAVPRAIAG